METAVYVPVRTNRGRPFRFDVSAIVRNVVEECKGIPLGMDPQDFIALFKRHVYPLPKIEEFVDTVQKLPPLVLYGQSGVITVEVRDLKITSEGLKYSVVGDVDDNSKKILENIYGATYAATMMILIRRKWDENYDGYGFDT